VQWADERYRGGPLNPISDADLDGKFRMCAEGVLDSAAQDEILALTRSFDTGADLKRLMSLMTGTAQSIRSAAE
jgi:hypothetical protein